MVWMHATTQNVFGVHTAYGTHPKPPRRAAVRVRRIAATTAQALAVTALTAWFMVRH